MEDENAVIYGLEFQARALAPQLAETEAIRFLVGTQSLGAENQVHLVDFDDDNNVISKNMFLHKEGEIWQLNASSKDKDLISTCYNKTSESKAEMRAAVWRIPSEFDTMASDEDPGNAKSLQLVTHLHNPEYQDTKSVLWHPSGEESDVISLVDNHMLVWDLGQSDSNARISSSAVLESKGHPKFTCGSWNPHHNCSQIATANDTSIRGWDLRSMEQVYHIENAHGQLVRGLDFNPNKQYHLASCGDDCRAKFWDVRNPTQPLKVISDHSHWVWNVQFNHFHDQLVLTSSSDSRVILSNAVSISSEPFGQLADEDDEDAEGSDNDTDKSSSRLKEPPKDEIIATFEEHEDSVYAVAWSSADPWIFASLSYDGRLAINRVPRATKYKILL